MKHVICLLALLAALPAQAEVLAVIPSDPTDGPYLDASLFDGDFEAPMSEAQLAALTDLDGDPATLNADEARMHDLLSQTLTVTPAAY